MIANHSIGQPAMPGLLTWRVSFLKRERGGLRIPVVDPRQIRRSVMAAGTMNRLLCVGLWISLLFAIWMSRGWIGVLFSGQLLSAGACLFQKLARKTQFAFSASRRPVRD